MREEGTALAPLVDWRRILLTPLRCIHPTNYLLTLATWPLQVLDMMLVWSRSLDTAETLCEKPGGMTEIAIKHFQVGHTNYSIQTI